MKTRPLFNGKIGKTPLVQTQINKGSNALTQVTEEEVDAMALAAGDEIFEPKKFKGGYPIGPRQKEVVLHRQAAKNSRMVEVAPNQYRQLDLSFDVPDVITCDVIPVPGQPGLFKLVPRSWEKLERVTAELCERLGLGGDTTTLRRLIRAGFVDGGRAAPKTYSVNLSSYYAHLKRCADDPDFWEDPKVMKQYQDGYF